MLSLLMPTIRKAAAANTNYWPRHAPPLGGVTKAGSVVTPENAYALSLVWCATAAISEAVALCPLNLYRKESKDSRVEADTLSAHRILKSAPNLQMDAAMFRESRTAHQVNYGGGFAEVQRDPRNGDPIALHPIHPGRVSSPTPADKLPSGERVPSDWYKVRNENRTYTYLPSQRMLHVPGRHSDDGVWARGVFAFAQEELGLAKATVEHAADYFGGGAQPRGLLTIPSLKPGDKETGKRIREDWEDMNRPGKRRVAVLGTEATYTPTSASMVDAEWPAAEQLNTVRVARWYRLPPHMLYDLTKNSYASIEAMGIEFLVFALMPWLLKWVGQAGLKLLSPSQRQDHYFEHNVAALMRGDLKTRMEAYQKGLMQGILTINEVRGMENLPRVGPEADKLYLPANLVSLEKLASGQVPPTRTGLGSDQSGTEPQDTERSFHAFAKANPLAAAGLQAVAADSHGDYGKEDVRFAARSVLGDALKRLAQVEATSAIRKVDSKGDFDSWVRDFYPRHQERLTEAVHPCIPLLGLAGCKRGAEEIAVAVAEYGRREICRLYNEQTRSGFHERMAVWAGEISERFTQSILGGQE